MAYVVCKQERLGSISRMNDLSRLVVSRMGFGVVDQAQGTEASIDTSGNVLPQQVVRTPMLMAVVHYQLKLL